MTNQNSEMTSPKYFSVRAFCERQNLSEGAVRSWLFFNQNDFTKKCTRKVGRKIYVLEEKFFEWMEGNNHA
jgi:hypothetical protein